MLSVRFAVVVLLAVCVARTLAAPRRHGPGGDSDREERNGDDRKGGCQKMKPCLMMNGTEVLVDEPCRDEAECSIVVEVTEDITATFCDVVVEERQLKKACTVAYTNGTTVTEECHEDGQCIIGPFRGEEGVVDSVMFCLDPAKLSEKKHDRHSSEDDHTRREEEEGADE